MKMSRIQIMRSKKGLTLIELLMVVIIVGILAAVAIPTYSNYMMRARRADGKTALEQLRAAQEMRRAERGSYETNIVALRTTWGAPGAKVGDYDITIDGGATATAFTGRAHPFTTRQGPDGDLTINQDGVKDPPVKWAR